MKKILLTLITLLLIVPTEAQNKRKNKSVATKPNRNVEVPARRSKVAVVLSGGGAKGVAHIGALKVIEEAGYPIDIICGTSMGALVGGLYAIGWSPTELDSLVRAQNWTMLLSDRVAPDQLNLRQREEQNTYALIRGITNDKPQSGGLIRGRNLMGLFRQLCTGYLDSIDFNTLPVRYACVASDIVTNTEVDFHVGYLPEVMRASMAIPGVFTPVRMGDSVLVDGGLRNNFPVDLAHALGADIVIGINVQNAPRTAGDISGTGDVFNQIIDINCKNKFEENWKKCNIRVPVDVSGYSAASFTNSAIDTLLRRGEEQTRAQWDTLLALRRKYGIDSTPRPTYFTHPIPNPEESDRKQNGVIGIPVARVGFRFDSEEMGAVQLGGSLPLHTRIPMQIDAHARLGRRVEGKVSMTIVPGGFTSPTLSYLFRRNDLNIYQNGERIYNVLYRQHQGDLIPFNFIYNNYNIRAGLRWDWFDYYGKILTSNSYNIPVDIATLSDEHWFSYRIDAEQNNENHWYFPEKGQRTSLKAAYITDNFVGIDGHQGLLDASANWRINFKVSKHLSLQPMLYGRVVLGGDVPVCYAGALGNEWFGHYVDQQMPFDGIKYIEYVERNFVALRLQAQVHPRGGHYLQLRFTAADCHDELADMLSLDNIILGTTLAYFYDTYFGPIGASIGYNNLSKTPKLYLTLGHRF